MLFCFCRMRQMVQKRVPRGAQGPVGAVGSHRPLQLSEVNRPLWAPLGVSCSQGCPVGQSLPGDWAVGSLRVFCEGSEGA